MIPVTPTLSLDDSEVELSFIRSSGPGGQNVNKVATAVQLRFDAAKSPALSHSVYRRLLVLAGRRATKEGVIVLTANSHRTQDMNRLDAYARLQDIVQSVALPPKPRRATRPTRASKERRLQAKSQRSAIKELRGKAPE